MDKKYRFDFVDIKWRGHRLRRIVALRNFGNVKAGDIGGFIEDEGNLSHEGNCWVYPAAVVYSGSYISGNAQVGYEPYCIGDSDRVFRHCNISAEFRGKPIEHGVVCENITNDVCEICEYSEIYGNAIIDTHSTVYNSQIHGDARVKKSVVKEASVFDKASIYKCHIHSDYDESDTEDGITCKIYGNAILTDCNIYPFDYVEIYDHVFIAHCTLRDAVFVSIHGEAQLHDCVSSSAIHIHGHASVTNCKLSRCEISGHAIVEDSTVDTFGEPDDYYGAEWESHRNYPVRIFGAAQVYGSGIHNEATVCGDAIVENSKIYGRSVICGKALLTSGAVVHYGTIDR